MDEIADHEMFLERNGCHHPDDDQRPSAAEYIGEQIDALQKSLVELRQLYKLADPLEKGSPEERAFYKLTIRGM